MAQGGLVLSHISSDVYTHFRITIPSGQSTFTLQMPHRYLEDPRRRFFFSQLHLVPNFYSLDAERLALDADPAIDEPLSYNFQVKLFYRDNTLVYGNEYINSMTLSKTTDLISAINQHFEEQKPSFAHTTPFFIDWIDTSLMKKQGDNIAEVISTASEMYYGGTFDADQFGNALPASVQNMEGVNNFIMPWSATTGQEIFNKRIRLRLWLAPYCKAVFSNIQVFVEDLGFEASKMGRAVKNQIHLTNSKPVWLPIAVARDAPKEQFTKRDFKIRLWVTGPYLHSKIKTITMTQREWLDDNKLTPEILKMMQEFSWSLNTSLSFSFDKDEKRYVLTFPDTDLIIVHLTCDPQFAHRIGMGYEPVLTKNMKAERQKDRMDRNRDAAKWAAAVVFDTGPIACVLDEMSSNTTSQSVDQIMTSLYPTGAGTLAMPDSCRCSQMASSSQTVSLSVNRYTGNSNSSITFRLLRIYDDQKLSNFAWTCDGQVYGVLQGTCLPLTH